MQEITDTARDLMADGRGLLAMDESIGTCNHRFKALGIPGTEELRREYRELLLGTPGLGDAISGAILCDETFRQARSDGSPMLDLAAKNGILVGIKVDAGAVPMALHAGETLTEGLDGLRQRLDFYFSRGARFAKWRAVFRIDEVSPSRGSLDANATALALYAGLCQEAGLLPIVETDVLMDGDHGIQRCYWATELALHAVFHALFAQRVDLTGVLLKPNMVLPGADSAEKDSVQEVALATVQCLLASVPAAVPGIAFLSGGQTPELATAHLKAMNQGRHGTLPWPLTFSFSRALQGPVLPLWRGMAGNVAKAQQALLERALANRAAVAPAP